MISCIDIVILILLLIYSRISINNNMQRGGGGCGNLINGIIFIFIFQIEHMGRFFMFELDFINYYHYICLVRNFYVHSMCISSDYSLILIISSFKYNNKLIIILINPIHPFSKNIVMTICMEFSGTMLPNKGIIQPITNCSKFT